MCGRFVSKLEAEIERKFSIVRPWWQVDWVSYNVAPTQPVPIIRLAEGERVGDMLRWGLIPPWAHGKQPKYSTINAKAETVETAASYRSPWKRSQRCLVPAIGYYEWKTVAGRKQPYFIRLAGGERFAFAGLWESSRKADGEVVESFTIITVPANPMVAEIHAKARMPAMMLPEDCAAWLEGTMEEARAALVTFPANQMDAYPVSTRANSPKNNSPELLEPIASG
ncbi:MAG: SOS response-associated peptidase [Ectothiorhodospiraceae bacterium]|nr:SOS response-associated peptidase [Ectothiorhodospiraceae bacterium]